MTKTFAVFPVLALGLVSLAPAQTKVGIINVQQAILSTKDGQKAATDLQARFAPKKAELDKKQASIAALQEQGRKGAATMSDEARAKLTRDIDSNTKALTRETEDAQAELDQEQGKVMQELGQKMMSVLDKYAKDNGYGVILDVSNPQTPVLWASNTVDVTTEIVALYDKANAAPATSAPKPTTGVAPPKTVTPAATPPAAAPKPMTPPAAKKK